MYLPPPSLSLKPITDHEQLAGCLLVRPCFCKYRSMSGGTATGRKDFLIKKGKVDLDAEISGKNDPILASFMSDNRKLGGGQANDMSQTICMFRKYLLSKSQNSTGKTNMEESEVLKTRCPHPLRPPKFGCNMPRQASFLEQKLLPGIRNEPVQSSPSNGKSPASQFTIFYEGAINVYDNVPLDKAQAIMLLAGESSLPRPVALELPKSEMRKPVIQSRSSTTLTANSKSEADLPIARKISLQHFLEKRRRRITSKAPYNSPAKTENNEETDEESRKDRGSSRSNGPSLNTSLSPFPSRLGYFSAVSTKRQ